MPILFKVLAANDKYTVTMADLTQDHVGARALADLLPTVSVVWVFLSRVRV